MALSNYSYLIIIFYLPTLLWFQVFLYMTNDLFLITWLRVFISNTNNQSETVNNGEEKAFPILFWFVVRAQLPEAVYCYR